MNLIQDLQNGKTTLDFLQNELGIKVKDYPEATPPRIVLNYDQIESPKSQPYVMQSRGLILHRETFEVLCLPFDRFFNMGEVIDHNAIINWSKAKCFEKVDGSLIKIYWDGMRWCIATRGTAFAESTVGGWELTFHDLVLKALGCETYEQFHTKCLFHLSFDYTYLFEVTAMENRVVTNYSGYTLWYLAARSKLNGKFLDMSSCVEAIGAKLPKVFSFSNVEDCITTANHLPDLQEGYVLYEDGVPVCKIKSPAYVAVHHIKSEGLNPKRIMQMVLANEQGEYLTYFGEDYKHIEPYEITLKSLKENIVESFDKFKHIESQKDFALEIKDLPFSSALFKARGGDGDAWKAFNDLPLNFRTKVLEGCHIE